MTAEATILLGQKKTALEIRDFLSGEFHPIPIADVIRCLRARERAGWRDPAGEEVMRGLDVHPVDSHNHDHDCGQYS